MSSRSKASLAITVLAFGLTAHAQESSEDKARPAQMIEEVFVTVSKRTESVQKVSAAVSAFSEALLKDNNIQGFSELADVTPGVVSREGNNISIRGIGQAFGGSSPVAFHVNGFFLAQPGKHPEEFYDVSSVEVIRGPSGTVYGKNATAGAVNVRWNRPSEEWAAGVDYRLADYNAERVRGFVNVPISGEGNSALMARISGLTQEKSGHLDNLLASGDDEPNSGRDYFYRMYLGSQVNDRLWLGLRAIKLAADIHAPNVASPSISTRQSGILEKFGAEPLPLDLLKVRSRKYQELPDAYRTNSRVVGELTWNMPALPVLGEVDLDFFIGAERRRQFDYVDVDGTEEKILETISWLNGVGRNAELRFTSQNDTGVDWIVGLFWFRDDDHDTLHVDARTEEGIATLYPQLSVLPLPERIFDAEVNYLDQNRNSKNEAAFINVRLDLDTLWSFMPDVEVFAGIRENRDEFRLKTARETVDATERATGITIPFTDKSTDVGGESSATTGEVGAKWFYAEGGMLYGKFANGYKPGLTQLQADGSLNDVDPEFLNMWELGWKTALFDNRSLVLNFSAFDYDYTDLQVSKIIITGVKLENAGSAGIRGLEADIQWAPDEAFYAIFSFAWLDARFREFCGKDEEIESQAVQPGCNSLEPHNFEGAKMSDSPEFTFGTLMRYTFYLGQLGTFTPALKFSWSDDYLRRPYDNSIDKVDAHHKTDIRLAWQSADAHFRVEAFVENIENHDQLFTHHFSMPDPGNYSLFAAQAPRTAGIQLEAIF